MQKVKCGVWGIGNVLVAFYLRIFVWGGCWFYYFENRMPPGEGGIHRVHLTQIDVAIAIFNASFCSALFAGCVAGFGLYLHRSIWQDSIVKNEPKRWGWWIFIINWIIAFSPSILLGYKFFVQRSAYF